MQVITAHRSVEKWGVFEASFEGPSAGNPFTEQWIRGSFRGAFETVETEGFYDGNGIFRIRFMPSYAGTYSWRVETSFGGAEGTFEVCEASENNHGPVRAAETYHFAYEDGVRFFPLGTTCYVWDLQSDEKIEETLRTLEENAFNKIRFCIFPKHYDYNLGEPRSYPYEGTPMDSSVLTKENFQKYTGRAEGNAFDYTRFRPDHFRHIEMCILELQKRGIEADLIVMHPYDRWGFSCMTREQDILYWKYVLARFSAFRNVWWSLANEHDFMPEKTTEDWELYGSLIQRHDPYRHLCSIHNGLIFYNHHRPWITHCSIQRQDLYKSAELVNEWREIYHKPVVLDEICYEGNIQHGWGNISGEEMVRRFWEAACRGGYPGHGETYMNEDDILWWSHGGKLHGESPKRFFLLRDILQETPGPGLMPWKGAGWDEICGVPENQAILPVKSYYLFFYSFMRPSFRDYWFDDETEFSVCVIDTWNMTRTDAGIHKGHFRVQLPGRPYMAVQIRKV